MISLDDMVALLKAGGEPTRLRLLSLLADGDLSVKDLTAVLNQSQPRISRHLKLLYEAGLVERLPEGAWVYYRLVQDGSGRAFVDACLGQLDREDILVKRDLERLAQVREANAKLASDYFQLNAERWDELRALHVPESAVDAAILDCLGDESIDQFLDLGTGTGSMLSLLADRCRHGVGIDANRSMLSIARSRLDGPNHTHLHVQQGDLLDLAMLEGRYDLVSLHQVLHYLDDPSAALSEAADVTAPEGRLLIVDFAPHDNEFLRRDHAHRRLGFSHEMMGSLLRQSGFTLELVRDLEPDFSSPELSSKPLIVTIWLARKCQPGQ